MKQHQNKTNINTWSAIKITKAACSCIRSSSAGQVSSTQLTPFCLFDNIASTFWQAKHIEAKYHPINSYHIITPSYTIMSHCHWVWVWFNPSLRANTCAVIPSKSDASTASSSPDSSDHRDHMSSLSRLKTSNCSELRASHVGADLLNPEETLMI